MDLMYGCGSDMDMSIQELFEQDMQNEINRMMSSDLGIDDLMGDATPLFQGLTEDGFDEFDLCFESSSTDTAGRGTDLFDSSGLLAGNKKLGAVVNVPLKSQVTSRNSGTTTVIIKGSNTQSTATATLTKHASPSVTKNGLGRPNVHRFGAQTRAIVTSAAPTHVRVMTSGESMPKMLSFDESYGGVMVSQSMISF